MLGGGGEVSISLAGCLYPFIALVQAASGNGLLLSSVLESVERLVRCGLFGMLVGIDRMLMVMMMLGIELYDERDSIPVYRLLVTAITSVRFDVGEYANDELLMLRFLQTLRTVLFRADWLSKQLGDQEMCSVVEMLFGLFVIPRMTEYARREVESAVRSVCELLLDRLREEPFRCLDDRFSGTLSITMGFPGVRGDEKVPLPPALAKLEAEIAAAKLAQEAVRSEGSTSGASASSQPTSVPPSPGSSKKETASLWNVPLEECVLPAAVQPYSILTILELFDYLLRILDIEEKKSSERLRGLCLSILADFIHNASPAIIHDYEPVWHLVSKKVARVAIQLFSYTETSSITLPLHRICIILFGRYRRAMMAQTELFITTLIACLNQRPVAGKPTPLTRISKEFYLELLAHLCLDPMFIPDLYVIFECGSSFGFVLTSFLGALTSAALMDPKGAGYVDASVYLLAIDVLLVLLRAVDTAVSGTLLTPEDPRLEPAELRKNRQLKHLHQKAAELFNADPKTAFVFLQEQQLLSSPPTVTETAKFLRRTAGLDKKAIGELLSKPSQVELFKEFLTDFNLAGLELDEALRLVLESFRLPGEAQQIQRIMEAIASAYYRASPHHQQVFRSEDAVFLLAYSIVMLNTDQHNSQVRHRMTAADFIRNNRGINDGGNFEEAFLRRIYQAIRETEIVMPEERNAETAFHFVWNEQLKKYTEETQTRPPSSLDVYVGDVMEMVWQPCLDCFKTCILSPCHCRAHLNIVVILSPRTEKSSSLAVRGFYELGHLADHYLSSAHLESLIGSLVDCLAFYEITANPVGNQLPRYLARSEMFKLLVRCFFDQFRLHGGQMRGGCWGHFVSHLLLLVQASVVTLATFEVARDACSPTSSTTVSPRSLPKSEIGLFSTLTQYLAASPSADALVDPETHSSAMAFVKTCRLEEIMRDSRFLPEPSLLSLLEAMTVQITFIKPAAWEVEALVFLIDLVVHTAWCNRDRISGFWDLLFRHFAELARDLSIPPILREHCILGVGRLALRLADRPEMQKEVVQFFQLLCYLPPDAFQQLADAALSLVLRIVELDPPVLHGTAIWPNYFTLLSLAARSNTGGPYAFALLTSIIREEGVLFPLEFYSEYVDLLNGFIAMAGSTASSLSASGEILPSPVDLAIQALYKLVQLEQNVRKLDGVAVGTGWNEYVIPVHCALVQQCYHPVRQVRQQALSLIQRTLLATDYGSLACECLLEEFRTVLLPLLEELEKAHGRVPRMSEQEMEEIQVRASSVLSRVLLSNLKTLFPLHDDGVAPGVFEMWRVLVGQLVRLLEGPGDLIRESVPETVKNMLLVMAASGVLLPGGTGATAELWRVTWEMLGPALPHVHDEITQMHAGDHPQGADAIGLANNLDQLAISTEQIVDNVNPRSPRDESKETQQGPSSALRESKGSPGSDAEEMAVASPGEEKPRVDSLDV